jgi:nicotinamidase-related amidase
VKHYEDTEFRQRMKNAKSAKSPVPIQSWCYHNSEHEGPWPIVDDIGRGEAKVTGCDDPIPRKHASHDRHQHPVIKIIGYDGISDNGQEIYNFLEQEGRNNIVLMGVHTNMCVLGRPFGIRQQKYLGKNVVLCRDLTDALYDPRDKPHVSHARGSNLSSSTSNATGVRRSLAKVSQKSCKARRVTGCRPEFSSQNVSDHGLETGT